MRRRTPTVFTAALVLVLALSTAAVVGCSSNGLRNSWQAGQTPSTATMTSEEIYTYANDSLSQAEAITATAYSGDPSDGNVVVEASFNVKKHQMHLGTLGADMYADALNVYVQKGEQWYRYVLPGASLFAGLVANTDRFQISSDCEQQADVVFAGRECFSYYDSSTSGTFYIDKETCEIVGMTALENMAPVNVVLSYSAFEIPSEVRDTAVPADISFDFSNSEELLSFLSAS